MIEEEGLSPERTTSRLLEENSYVQVNDNMTQYDSAKSSFHDIDEIEIKIKSERINEYNKRRAYLPYELGNDYNLNKEFEQMKVFIDNQEWDKVKQLDGVILSLERKKREQEISLRLQNFENFEENFNKMTKVVNLEEHINHNNLCLVNLKEDEGYTIIKEEEADRILDSRTFCGYDFYTKK